jgi:SAM-dependent methyltransferase
MLVTPSANRVYADASVRLTRAELEVFDLTVLGGRLSDVGETTLGGVPYLTFTADDELSDADIRYLSNLSTCYALFRHENGRLEPIEVRRLDCLDDDLLTIQKYVGKTNEYFTKLLLNVTIASTTFAHEMLERPFRVLDPLCGRGTTLNQALMYGYHAAGLDLDGKDFEAYAAFIKTWLRRKRLKHTADVTQVRRDRKVVARRCDVNLGLDKDAYRAGDTRSLTVINADTTRAGEFFRPETFDVVVTDAPYGVQHGSHTARLRRDPVDLLTAAVPGWTRLLRPGGALGISWNTHVAERDTLAALLADAGLLIRDTAPYQQFRHRVDQAIARDLVVGVKPTP